MSSAPGPFRKEEVESLIDALLEKNISDDQFRQLDQWLSHSSEARQLYFDYLQIHHDLPDMLLRQAELADREQPLARRGAPTIERRAAFWPRRAAALLATALMAPIALFVGIYVGNRTSKPQDVAPLEARQSTERNESDAQFLKLAHARFFGELPPEIGASPDLKRDYVLIQGMVELGFTNGASAVIEGPASFRVEASDLLALDIGQCSVHAPPGAEGFRVQTPDLDIVDRGTRFSVSVSQDSQTDVQVVEGAADVYRNSANTGAAAATNLARAPLRLREKEAVRFAATDRSGSTKVPFNADRYQFGLPDRVVKFEATRDAQDLRAQQLTSVTIQRGQQVQTIPFDELIPAQAIWFHALENHGYLVAGQSTNKPDAAAISDRSLRTGVINIGGSEQPLTADPVMTIDESRDDYGTPGLGIKFARPVRNGPGPDVVLFELQLIMNPLEGDAFHVSPLQFAEGLRTHTVTAFDLTMESPESLRLGDLYLYKFDQVPRSLEQLTSFASQPIYQNLKQQAIAVGIDLSDLGYADGALVDGLFFQDNLADDDFLDPILIAGLPELEQP